ncbi:MAG: hypothetical protein Q9167_007887 [Letrouitia subvulpina]
MGIKWEPVVLSFSFSSKELKGKDPLAPYRTRLEELDIKVAVPYYIDRTTHVVQSKRNTAKGLQALINGKYIVTDSFVDALVYATTPEDFDEAESLSPLEVDFDQNWPDALQHLPSKGKEPNERPVETFAPNPERINIFEGYTVVFCERVQFESLQAPVTNGGGKALFYPLKPFKTTTEDLVRYVKNAAGEKGLGELEDGSEGKGVVVVKFRGGKDDFDWAAKLGTELALALDLRLIEQNEFMDAILMNNASVLRRPLPEEDEEAQTEQVESTRNEQTPSHEQALQQAPQPEVVSNLPRHFERGRYKRRFKAFDDDEEEDSKPESMSAILAESQMERVPNESTSQRGPANQGDPSEVEANLKKKRYSRKRPAPPSEDEEDVVDQLLPAATAIKRRRLEQEEEARRRGISPSKAFAANGRSEPPSLPKPKEKEVDYQKLVRERREAEEEAARRDEESLRGVMEGQNVEAMRNLAVVEEMEVFPRRSNAKQNVSEGVNPRWEDQWNGRKNFKKFRSQGEDGRLRRMGQSVMVPLEEVKRKEFGIGEEYWLESTEKVKRKRKEKEKTTSQSQSQSQRKSQTKSIPKELVVDDGEELPEVVNVDAPRTTRSGDAESSSRATGKRRAESQGREGEIKKQKTFAVRDSDSESEDEMKFRFGRRKRG